jgi:hypothetical protein
VVSSTSMKVLDMTAIAISQGLISGWACGLELMRDLPGVKLHSILAGGFALHNTAKANCSV